MINGDKYIANLRYTKNDKFFAGERFDIPIDTKLWLVRISLYSSKIDLAMTGLGYHESVQNSICTMSSKPRVFRYGHGMNQLTALAGDRGESLWLYQPPMIWGISHINVTHVSNTYTHIYIYIYIHISCQCHREYHLTPVHIEYVIQNGPPQWCECWFINHEITPWKLVRYIYHKP